MNAEARVVFFDVDGVLLDSLPQHLQRNIRKVLYCVKCEIPVELGVPQLSGQVWYATPSLE
jgi:beta-phosphoglucomutase-like phosphatase (HAD superfamily)